MEVDHFVPWSRYPTDLGHNFVLSHPGCNNAKSDHLAAEEHLAAWIERNRIHAAEIDARLAEAALPHDFAASVRIAEWAYEQTEQANGQVWVSQGRVQAPGTGVAAVVGGVDGCSKSPVVYRTVAAYNLGKKNQTTRIFRHEDEHGFGTVGRCTKCCDSSTRAAGDRGR